jgi:primosomal protein N' (replication factor Y)
MRSVGSKAVVDELSRLFPDAVIKRFDTDNDKNDHLLSHIEDLKSGKIQIIVGTQMIAKGLDLPKLKSLVVFAGGSSSGYMSEEREFELLYQVLGRAMRGHQDTSIVIQTSNPDSAVLSWVIDRDYDSFMSSELADRKAFHYPPFCYMMLIHIRRKSSTGTAAAAQKLVDTLKNRYPKLQIGSPTPNTVERLGPFYNWHIIIKSNRRSVLTTISEQIGTSFQCELDPVDIP